MFLQRPRVRFDGNVVIDYKTSTVIIYLSIHIKLSNCDFILDAIRIADTMLPKRLIDFEVTGSL